MALRSSGVSFDCYLREPRHINHETENYLQNPRGDSQLPGALGLGQAHATIIQNAFLFFGYLTPLPFALISDRWIGRYKTMLISTGCVVDTRGGMNDRG
jgi:hypothetical protein